MRFFSILLLCFLNVENLKAQSGWQEYESPVEADLHNIFFVNNSVGWIVTHSTGAVFHTKDGGKNWSKQKIADEKSWIYSVHFFNEQNGLAIGMRTSRPLKGFLKTNNGGEAWSSLKKSVPKLFTLLSNFINNQEGYGGLRYILHTKDGGETWEKQFPDSDSDVDNQTVIRDISFVNSQNGWAVGHRGLILKTKDGQNWERREQFTKNCLRDIAFVNESNGYIAGDSNEEPGVLYRTNDGGKNWQTVLSDTADLNRIELTEKKLAGWRWGYDPVKIQISTWFEWRLTNLRLTFSMRIERGLHRSSR